jgi:hypothetical protein
MPVRKRLGVDPAIIARDERPADKKPPGRFVKAPGGMMASVRIYQVKPY